ncbi:MAG: N-acylneuraminate-9-phosphate synthase [Cyanobacteria bacterium RYN_339]|nr:N-acylneuraminate-9-phosphate synthase [Cyanobacteria bacterium RYN_339]
MSTHHGMAIAGRPIGAAHPVYVIAEMSANHNQDFDQAERIVRAAKDAGADAIKVQTYTPDTITIDSQAAPFRIKGTLWEGRNLYDLYKEAYTPWEWQPRLKRLADELGLAFFSSPFDPTAVDFLEMLEVPAYKVASFELVDLPLIRKMAATGKPLIMSTGMATLGEIEEAVGAARGAGARELALLKCTSAYPALPGGMNLRSIPHLAATFGVPAGLSDHTLGIEIPMAAVALGACIVEKHFTLARELGGPDAAFSLEPPEFKAMVVAVRNAQAALGEPRFGPGPEEVKSLAFRRSLFVVKDMHAGETFTPENVRSIRPSDGLHTRYYEDILGRRAAADLPFGTPLAWHHVVPVPEKIAP